MSRARRAAIMAGVRRRLHPRAVLAPTRPAARPSPPSRWPAGWPRDPTSRSSAWPGRHRAAPDRRAGVRRSPIGQLGLPRPALYEAWLRLGRPPRRARHRAGRRGPRHRARAVPVGGPAGGHRCTTSRSCTTPTQFTRQGLRVMRRSLDVTRDTAAMVVTSSAGQSAGPGGVRRRRGARPGRAARRDGPRPLPTTPRRGRVRRPTALPERFALFVGTLEPRKNLRSARRGDRPAGRPAPARRRRARRAGATPPTAMAADVRFLGFVAVGDLPALYAAATVFAYPSESRGLRPARARGDGPGHAGRHQRRHVDRGGRRGRRRARRSVRHRRHRRRHRRGPASGRRAVRRRTGPGGRADVGRRAERTLDVYRDVLGRTQP